MQHRQLRLPVPVHIITGALGSGKTTAICALLACKPEEEVWALVINEAGAVGVDAALLSSSTSQAGVTVRELAGGCMCCVLSGVTSVAIAKLVREVKPDRLVIEPSGLGHPAALVDILQGQHLRSALALQPIACLVDATRFAPGTSNPGSSAGQLFLDQVSIADVLVGSKADLCDAAMLKRFQAWAEELFPPKQLIATCAHGQLDTDWLGLQPRYNASSLEHPSSRSSSSVDARNGLQALDRPRRFGRGTWLTNSPASAAETAEEPSPGQPLHRVAQQQSGDTTCGWVFHVEDTFCREPLQALLDEMAQSPALLRLKGVFRVSPKTWMAANHVTAAAQQGGGEHSLGGPVVQLRDMAYRGRSRVEVIVAGGASSQTRQDGPIQQDSIASVAAARAVMRHDWDELELKLKRCLATV